MITATAIVLCIIGMALQAAFITAEYKKSPVWALILKGSASIVFVIIGYFGFKHCSDAYFGRMVLLGLVFGAIGDILLNLRFLVKKSSQIVFLAGIAAFLTGHVMYLLALIPYSKYLLPSIIIGAVLGAALLWYTFKKINVKLAFMIFGIAYLGVIVIMTAVAIGNVIAVQETCRLLFAIGAVLFTISDVVLIFNTFGEKPVFSKRILNLSCYYIAQLFIAVSIFFK